MSREGRRIAPDWLTLRLFLASVEAGSVTRAAEALAIATSAAAKRIQVLEENCGLALLERHARGVRPTAAGAAMVRHARALLDLSGRLTDDMHALAAGGLGSVRLHATTSAIIGHGLAESVAGFSTANPRIQVEMRETTSAAVLHDLVDGRADLGIVTSGNAVPPGFAAHAWREDRLMVLMRHDHRLAGRASLDFATVLDHPLVGAIEGGALSVLLGREAQRLGRDLRYRFRVAGTDASRTLVAAGLGIGVAPEGMVRAEGSDLVGIPLEEGWAFRQLHLVRPAGDLPPPSRRLLDHLLPG